MVYLLVALLTFCSVITIIFLFDASILAKLIQIIIRLTASPQKWKPATKSFRVGHLSTPTNWKNIGFIKKEWSVSILIACMIVLTLGGCYWLVNYSAMEVYNAKGNQRLYNAQVNALLVGEQLRPPPSPPESLFDELEAEIASYQAGDIDTDYWGSAAFRPEGRASLDPSISNPYATDKRQLSTDNFSSDMLAEHLSSGHINIKNADRNWSKINSVFMQRLLMVYKIMHDEYGYDMVLLEGYRSPQRQARLLAKGGHVTKAGAYRSYHQFGLAADSAFIKNGKIVISERDPWAMRGYRLYGQVAKSVGLTWGGDWKMMDLGHVELRKKGVLGRPEQAKLLTSQ